MGYRICVTAILIPASMVHVPTRAAVIWKPSAGWHLKVEGRENVSKSENDRSLPQLDWEIKPTTRTIATSTGQFEGSRWGVTICSKPPDHRESLRESNDEVPLRSFGGSCCAATFSEIVVSQ